MREAIVVSVIVVAVCAAVLWLTALGYLWVLIAAVVGGWFVFYTAAMLYSLTRSDAEPE